MIRNLSLVAGVLIWGCGENSKTTAGTWVEVPNGISVVEVFDANGKNVQARVAVQKASQYFAGSQMANLPLGQAQALDTNVRYVLLATSDSIAYTNTFISDVGMDTLKLTLRPRIDIEGVAPTSFDSIFLVGQSTGAAIQGDGTFKLNQVPVGKGLFVLKKNGQWYMGGERILDQPGKQDSYSVLGCLDEANRYEGQVEKSFIGAASLKPYMTTSLDTAYLPLVLERSDSVEVSLNNLRVRAFSARGQYSYAQALVSNNNYLEFSQLQSWPLCVQILKSLK